MVDASSYRAPLGETLSGVPSTAGSKVFDVSRSVSIDSRHSEATRQCAKLLHRRDSVARMAWEGLSSIIRVWGGIKKNFNSNLVKKLSHLLKVLFKSPARKLSLRSRGKAKSLRSFNQYDVAGISMPIQSWNDGQSPSYVGSPVSGSGSIIKFIYDYYLLLCFIKSEIILLYQLYLLFFILHF